MTPKKKKFKELFSVLAFLAILVYALVKLVFVPDFSVNLSTGKSKNASNPIAIYQNQEIEVVISRGRTDTNIRYIYWDGNETEKKQIPMSFYYETIVTEAPNEPGIHSLSVQLSKRKVFTYYFEIKK